ncbi:class I SAM-dependent methyltransferase [Spiroplasma endosymbiont of Panorpa germanica]|uniref:class I SAM-dependent methyltransferase n=1 Tax=Spiroplasma endosymbiont of Panorpa germanica TaxID=3066314 RepID=UPI0030D1BB82
MKNYYPSLSGLIYDMTKPVGYSVDGDLDFYFDQVKNYTGNILEAGVGTGRMMVPFLRKGIKMVGIDSSKEMLEICQNNLTKYNQEALLIHDELINLSLTQKYDAILMPTGTICLIEDRNQVMEILKNFKNILTKEGKLVVDLIYPTNFKPGVDHSFDYQIDDNRVIKLTNKSKEIDWVNQKTISQLVYEDFQADKIVETQVQQFNLNWYGVEEFKNMLLNSGFSKLNVEINYGMKRVLNLKTVTIIAS